MATTTNFTVTKDTRIARRESDNYDSGAGTGTGLAFGLYSGYRYRALLGFNINMAGWTSITSAVFHYKTSNQINVAFGSDPTMLIQRITQAWSEGSASALSASNASIYPGPSATATNQVEEDAPTGENTWGEVAITGIMRDALTTGVFHGIRILGSTNTSVESDSSANVGEIYAREGSGDAYITITYETNRAPDVPTVSSPDVANGGLVASQTPTLNVYMTDPDGNAINNYHWQIDDNADFSSPIQDIYGGAAGASGVTVPVVPAALPRGGTYYFRVQAADVSVWGGWSGTFSFKVASYPTLTLSEPSASGRLARLTYDAGSGWGSPRMVVNWSLVCPDGGYQQTWHLQIYNDAAGGLGTVFYDSSPTGNTNEAAVVPANLIEGNYYHVRVTGTCSHGLTQQVTYRVRARWGYSVHRFDMGATAIGSLALTTLDVTDESTGGQGRAVVEYQTSTGTGIPSTWFGSIGGAGLSRYFFYRVWLLTWGASPSVSPTLNELKITYSTSVITPDKWSVNDSNNVVGDVSSFVYGTKSLRMKGVSNWLLAHQQIAVVPNTYYVLSGRIQTSGPVTAAYVGFASNGSGGGDLVQAQVDITKAIAFENPASRVLSTPWFSGSNTSVWVRLSSFAPVGTSVWFDAIKAEASTVVTPWSPGYVANAVVLDAGGLQIDAANGGIFRLRGSNGGARDIVEVGPQGLLVGGDTPLFSGSPGALETYGHVYGAMNMVVNGSFEQGLGAWTQGGSIMSVATDDKVHGWQSVKFAPGSYSYVAQVVQIVAGRRYVGSFWMKAGAGFNAPSGAGVVIEGVTIAPGGLNYALVVSPPNAWTRYTFQFTATNSGSFALLATNTYGGVSTGTLWIDNIMVQDAQWPYVDTPNPMRAGPAFSGDLRPGSRFYRTDLNMEFFYDGTRWLSTQLFEYEFWLPTTSQNMSVTTNITNGRIFPRPNGLNIYVVAGQILFTVNGGTALSASNKWQVDFNWSPADGNIIQFSIESGAVSVNRHLVGNTNAREVPGNDNTFAYLYATKVGTPGPLYLYGLTFSYRAIAT